jgi:peptidase M28-like protein
MDAARAPRRRRRPGRSGSTTALDGRLVRVGLVVAAPAVAALLLAVSASGPLPRSPLEPLFDGVAAQQLADTLTAEYPSRIPGTVESANAARWYRETLSAVGIQTTEDVWREDIPDLGRVTLRNVIGVVPGRSPSAIVVVAHRDNAGPQHREADNASGTATLVELARGFAPQQTSAGTAGPQHTLVFVSTDGGAYGGAGAERFASASELARSVVAAVVIDDPASSGEPRIGLASDAVSSPPQALVRTASARVREEVGVTPALPPVTTELVDLGVPYAYLEQGRLLGHRIAAVSLSRERQTAVSDTGARQANRLGQMGKAVEAIVDSVDESAGVSFPTPDALYFAGRVVRGWAVRLTLVLLVVPIVLATVDLFARARRRRISIAPAVRGLRTRLAIWLFGSVLLAFAAQVGVLPTGAALPLPRFTNVVTDPPIAGSVALSALFVLAWLIGRRRLVPRRRATPDERLAGLLVALLALCALAVALAIARPYALVFVLPSLYCWPWIPVDGASWRGWLLLAGGLMGPLLGFLALATQIGFTLTSAALYTLGLATVGYISLASVLAAVVWLAVAAQAASLAVGRYAPYADGVEPPPRGVLRNVVRRSVRKRP